MPQVHTRWGEKTWRKKNLNSNACVKINNRHLCIPSPSSPWALPCPSLFNRPSYLSTSIRYVLKQPRNLLPSANKIPSKPPQSRHTDAFFYQTRWQLLPTEIPYYPFISVALC